MRKAFVNAITPILKNNKEHVFITGDLGFGAFEELQDTLGKRFINAGVAEQNMVSVAAGMAKLGYRPWVYSITPFATLRCLEQIRNDVCFANLPVTIVGNGGGFTYGMNGPTHFGLDDLGIMKCMPNMRSWFPHHSYFVGDMVCLIATRPEPAYLRLGISPYESKTIGGGILSSDVKAKATVVGIGQAWNIAIGKAFSKSDIDVRVITTYPYNERELDDILESVRRTQCLIVIDEHLSYCSLGKDLMLIVARLAGVRAKMQFLGNVTYGTANGDSLWHHKRCGLTPEALISLVKEATQ